jgi:alanine racemase
VQSSTAAPSLAVREADLRTSIRPTVAEVDLVALTRNAARIRTTVGAKVAIYAVVKADAYGHGAVHVASVLEPVVDGFAVSLVEEGLELRDAGVAKPIIVLGAYYDHYHSEVLEAALTPVIYDLGDFERFGRAPVRRQGRGGSASHTVRCPVHVKIDTGMNRLGLDLGAVPRLGELVAQFPLLDVEGLCTHMASADLDSPDATLAQLYRFDQAIAAARTRGVEARLIHAANSAATVRFAEARFTAIRPGLALYGAMPSEIVARPDLDPVLTLRTRIMALHRVPSGGQVSYGGRWRAVRESAIATLPMGYADGYPRHIEGGEVLIRGQRAKVVGAICMDMMMVDVTDVPGVAVGDDAVIIGRSGKQEIRVDDLARWSGTISYEVLCGISKRVPRIYRGRGAA